VKGIVKVILVLLLLSILGGVVKIVFFPAHIFNKGIDTAYKIADKTLDADNVLQNYEWFKQQYEDYIAIDKKILNAEQSVQEFTVSAGDRSKWTFEDKTEYSRLSTIATGLKQQREDIIAEYNAKSKMQNRSLFKTKDLPFQLN
jgi:hypothetical protein